MNKPRPEHHLKLVGKIARELCRKYNFESFDDLFQEGAIGLIKACDRYNPTHPQDNWASFASLYIRGAILQYIRSRTGRKESKRFDPMFKYRSLEYESDFLDPSTVEDLGLADITTAWLSEWEYSKLDRTVLWLYYVEGLTYAAISRRLGMCESNVARYRRRGLTRLKAMYERTIG